MFIKFDFIRYYFLALYLIFLSLLLFNILSPNESFTMEPSDYWVTNYYGGK